MCEFENIDNWTWFLGNLKEYLANARQLTSITNSHKGILNALNLEFYGSQKKCVKLLNYIHLIQKIKFYFILQL